MKLMTEELEKKYAEHPFGSQEGKGFDADCIAHFFNPMGTGDWFITEAEKEDGEWIMFGYADLGLGPDCSEFGYISLSELEEIKLPFGMSIEQDSLTHGTVREMLEARGMEYDDFYASSPQVTASELSGNISAYQIDDALEVISDAIYQLEDKVLPSVAKSLGINNVSGILYDAYAKAVELIQHSESISPEQKQFLMDKYNLEDSEIAEEETR